MIVPRSTQLITQDSEYGLFTVTLFKKVMDEFKLHAREKKFIVRDFTYNEEELAAGMLYLPFTIYMRQYCMQQYNNLTINISYV